MKLLELITNNDGTLSRTQVNMWIVHFTCLSYLILEVVMGDVLSTPLLVLMCIYVASSHADRMDARRFQIRVGQAEVNLNGKEERN